MGRFITFEGIEGAGKTTQIKMVGSYLRTLKIPFLMTREPGGTKVGRKIRQILLNLGDYTLAGETELLLFLAARVAHVQEVILPGLKEGKWILCDRYIDATYAYQGFGRGIDIDLIEKLHVLTVGSLKPDLTFLLDLPVEIGLRRALSRIAGRKKNREDRFEREVVNFHQKIREGYLSLARKEPERFVIVDAARKVEDVHHEILKALRKVL